MGPSGADLLVGADPPGPASEPAGRPAADREVRPTAALRMTGKFSKPFKPPALLYGVRREDLEDVFAVVALIDSEFQVLVELLDDVLRRRDRVGRKHIPLSHRQPREQLACRG